MFFRTFAKYNVYIMEQDLLIYNTLTRSKQRFEPLHAPNVGMYVDLRFMATRIWVTPVRQ